MTATPNYQLAGLPRASFLHRLGAAIYDALLAFAVYALAGIIGLAVIAMLQQLGWLSLASNTELALALQQSPVVHAIYQLWLLICVVGFYSYFWSRTGQTLGMKAWQLRVQHTNGQNISPVTAVARCFWSLLGLGNLLLLLSQQQLALQDRLSDSEVVQLPKR
ncbi:RDD family protein [Shewanella mangrovi]|uniref:RDD family protein n=1 Tax=Shewanella mangrovi TaxID=1515746 RepID=UPI000AE7EFFF|nr:RDD family protein [Shewanella mangrovi]